jgi:hypothetical protein
MDIAHIYFTALGKFLSHLAVEKGKQRIYNFRYTRELLSFTYPVSAKEDA